MGALLSGLLGAAGADIEKQSDRAYQEKRQERLDRMRILELAASNPNTKPEALSSIFGELDDLAKDAGYKSANKGVKNPFSQVGKAVQHILTRKQQQQGQQAGQIQGRVDVANAPGVTAQPAGGAPAGGPPAQPAQGMPPMSAATQRMGPQIRPEMFYKTGEQEDLALTQEGKRQRQSATIGREEGSKDFDFWYKKGSGLGLKGRDLAEYAATKGTKLPAGGASGLSKEWVTVPGSEDPVRAWVDKNNPGSGYMSVETGEKLEGAKASGAPTKERLYSAIQGYYHYWLGKGLNPKDALARAGEDFRENQGKHLGRLEQQAAIDAALSGVGLGRGFTNQPSNGAGRPATPGNGQPSTTAPIPPPSRPTASRIPATAGHPTTATAPLRATLNHKESEDVQYYLSSLSGGVKGSSKASQVRVQNGLRALGKITGLDPMELAAEVAEQPALAKQLVNTAEREGAIMQLNSTLAKHGPILVDVAKSIQQTNSPLFTGPIREWKRRLAGSPELKRFEVALNAMEREYGRLTSSPLSKGQLPVDTSKHMQKIFSEDSSLAEIVAEVEQVQVEGNAEEQAMRDSREKIKAAMRSGKIGQAVGVGAGNTQQTPSTRVNPYR